MKQRLLYFDNLKGFAILLVVLGHCIQANGIDGIYAPIYKVIYSFHMPLFMAISGYFGYKERINIKEEVSKKLRRLMLPYLMWGGVKITIDGGNPITLIVDPDCHLWFLWDLFFISLLFSGTLALHLNKKKTFTIMILASALFLVTGKFIPSNDYNVKSICWMFQFYVAGALFRTYENKVNVGKFTIISLFLSYTLLEWFSEMYLLPRSMESYFFKMVIAYVAVILCLLLFRRIANIQSPLVMIGQATLGIYAVHQWIIPLIEISNILINFVITVVLSVVFVLAIRKTKYLKLLIGEL